MTVTGEAQPVSTTSASVTIVTREIIEGSRAHDVGDLLRQAPFLLLQRSGGSGAFATVSIRGGKTNFTLVMIDGIPVNDISDTLGGSFDFSTLSTDNVERIEIVRGPLSSVYGSEAVDGVINIISRTGKGKPAVEAGGYLGNFGAGGARLGATGEVGRWSYGVEGSYSRIGEQIGQDAFHLATVGAHTQISLGANKTLDTTIRFAGSHADAFPPNGGGPEYSILRDPQHARIGQTIGGAVFRHQVKRWWTYALSIDVFDRQQDLEEPAILDAVKPSFRSVPAQLVNSSFRRYRYGVANAFTLGRGVSAHVSVSERREVGSSDGLLAGTIPNRFQLVRSTFGASGELAYQSGPLTASIGVRFDKTPGFARVWSPRAGFGYRIGHSGPRVRASWGRGYKLPSFFALGDQTIGNRNLRPERSESFDLGIAGATWQNRLSGEITFFRNRYTDLVDFSAQLFRLVNRSQAITKGVELASTLAVSEHLSFGAHGQYVSWALEPAGEPLRDVPRWRGGLNATWKPAARWSGRAEQIWVTRRYNFQVPVPAQKTVGGYAITNLVASYKLGPSVTAFARIDNLFDHHYHEFIGFPAPGAEARVGLEWRIQ